MHDASQRAKDRQSARLFADHDFPLPAVVELRRLGHDVMTALEAGQDKTPDEDLLTRATLDGRAVVTHNRIHFRNLHRKSIPHVGIFI